MTNDRTKRPEAPDCGSLLPLVRGSPAAVCVSSAGKAEALSRGRSLGVLKDVFRPFRQQGWLRRAAAGCRSPGAAALLLFACSLQAQVASVSVEASAANNQVTLSWPAVAGATGYTVKRATSLTSTPTTLVSNGAALNYTDATAASGTPYYYIVTAVDGGGESLPRGVWASPGVIVDNATAGNTSAGVSFTGTWAASSVSGSFGNAALFSGQVTGATPTATYTFTPTIPARGMYDVYLHWTAHSNRATNTPIDLVLADETRTLTVNQEVDGGQWNRIATVPCEAGTTTSVVIRNNGANGNVVADGVQFVPRIGPWAPDADLARDYTVTAVEDDFDGTALDGTKWGQFLDRKWYEVSGGHLHLYPTWIGTTPLVSATNAEIQNEANWEEGGIFARSSQKFGYYEVRLRIPQVPAIGVDTAFWPSAKDNYLHSYEIDFPEFFNKDADGSSNNFGFGVWDHYLPTRDSGHLPGRTWDYTGNNNSIIGNMAKFVVIGMEWRTDNSLVVFINGVKKYTAPSSGMNDVESIMPAGMILSTKVVDWLTKNAELDASEATWDYVRYYQKPGWSGAVNGDWSNAANWGTEGIPSGGMAAVFNMPSTTTSVSVTADQSFQSMSFDGVTTPAHTFSGSGALRLGEPKAGDTTVTHGGILLNTEVQTNQTFHVPIVALQSLQFANTSRRAGGVLTLNGAITGSGTQDVEFITAMPGVGATTLGQIVLGQPIGAGIRDVTKAGDATFVLPANNLHTGKTAIARGPVSFAAISALGASGTEPLAFRPNTRHSESFRPRLIYTGPAASTSRPIAFTGYAADGVIEASGSGVLTWSGSLSFTLKTSDPARAPSPNAFFTLGGTNTGDNTFAGNLSDAGVSVTHEGITSAITLTINKANGGTWVLTGTNSTKAALAVNGGKLFIGSGTSGSFDAPSVSVSSGAEIGFGRDDAVSFNKVISGSGGLRKRGAGMLTLGGDHTFTGSATVDAGGLNLSGTLATGGTLSVGLAGRLTGNGVCGKAGSISGVLEAKGMTFSGNVQHFGNSKLEAQFAANNSAAISPVNCAALTITAGAKVDVVLSGTTNFLSSYWRTARSIPLMTMTSRSGSFSLGTVSNDSAGNAAATYGSFTLQQTATAVNLLWTPIPGFPAIDDPSLSITSPSAAVVALTDASHALRLTSTVGGNAAITWSVVSGPGTATFANANAADTTVSFSIAGSYVLRATASNALGSVTQDITVAVAPPASLTLRQGVNGYTHDATFIRADTTTWNSGARDQMLVGKNNSAFRALLSFGLGSVPAFYTVSSAQLDVWTDFAATGSVQALELRSLTRSFIEGTGNGSVATNGIGTGADWATHDGSSGWNSPGGDFGSEVLASVPGFNAVTTVNAQQTFASSPALVTAVTSAITSGTPLNFAILSPLTEAGAANNFTRLSSDDHATLTRRPQLTLQFAHPLLPTVNPGTAPSAVVGENVLLSGSVTNATSSTWSLASGPGQIWFINATTIKFSAPGSYLLTLSAINSLGEAQRTLTVTVTGPAMTPIEIWRQTHFGTTTAPDTADVDGDGVTNLMEYATAMNPAISDKVPASAVKAGNTLEFTYTKNKAATDVTYTVEWSDDLLSWSTAGVTSTILTDNGTTQQIKATVPAGGTKWFVRLMVSNSH